MKKEGYTKRIDTIETEKEKEIREARKERVAMKWKSMDEVPYTDMIKDRNLNKDPITGRYSYREGFVRPRRLQSPKGLQSMDQEIIGIISKGLDPMDLVALKDSSKRMSMLVSRGSDKRMSLRQRLMTLSVDICKRCGMTVPPTEKLYTMMSKRGIINSIILPIVKMAFKNMIGPEMIYYNKFSSGVTITSDHTNRMYTVIYLIKPNYEDVGRGYPVFKESWDLMSESESMEVEEEDEILAYGGITLHENRYIIEEIGFALITYFSIAKET